MVKNSSLKAISIAAAALVSLLSVPASAAPLLYDQNVTPDVIFGSGNSNGNFTVDQNSGIELGLRAKIPFNGIVHSNGNGTYSYSLAEANPKWNFDWTVNTDHAGTTSQKISDLTYVLGIDFDPGIGTDFFAFDPITLAGGPVFPDHSIGNNSTGNGAGAEATSLANYQSLIDTNNVLQQSWRHGFFTALSGKSYDPTVSGIYDIYLSAFDGQRNQVARTQIRVFIGVPEPTAFALMGFALFGMALYRRKKLR